MSSGVSYASAGVGTTTHLAPELLKLQAGFLGTHVPYRGSGPSMPDVLTGRIQAVFYSPAAVQPYIDDKRVRAIAQTGATRSQTNPSVPTGIESGFPNFRVDLWTAVFVPSAIPKSIVNRLAAQFKKVVDDPNFSSAMLKIGAEPFYHGPAEAATFVRKDYDKGAELIQLKYRAELILGPGCFMPADATQCAVKPPSTGRPTPITKLAAGLHSHSTAAATSSARPRRPIDCCFMISAIASA